MDEVHVAFTHAPGGSHAQIAADLPIITAEETDWGMMRYGTRKTGDVRHTIHYAPNMVRVLVPPLAGMDGVGGWPEIILIFTPVDDENCIWFGTSKVFVTGDRTRNTQAKRVEFAEETCRSAADQARSCRISGAGSWSTTKSATRRLLGSRISLCRPARVVSRTASTNTSDVPMRA